MQEITLKNVKTKLGNYWILFTDQKNLNMETIFTNTENSKTNESSKFIYEFNSKLNLKNPNNKNIGLVNLSIYYTWKNFKSSCNNNIFKISAQLGMMNWFPWWIIFYFRHSGLLLIYHQKTRNFGWKSSHKNLRQ